MAGFFELGYRTNDAHPDEPGAVIGRYRLVAPLGEGGFGFVWHAEQIEPIHRELALKLIKRGMDSLEVIARFEAESQALAMMDHPNIAAVLDAGTAPDGRPFFAMELVKGEPLTTYCDSRCLSIRDRLELFIPVCQAVQHAHQKAILHRDLKPSNILVSVVDGRAVPKVIDFGISKALGTGEKSALHDSLLRTCVGMIVGTPDYMSPEQAGSVPDVDTRSDIYSLGVILYEILAGVTPLARFRGELSTYEETLRRIRVEEPLKPSACFHPPSVTSAGVAANRGADPARLRKMIRGELDWIVLKALEKDRRRRYETATALAADLKRFLRQEPVSAAAPTWNYQFSKFARRNRAGFITAGIVSTALVGGTAVSLWQAREARKAGVEAKANYDDARHAVEQYLSRVTDNPRLMESNFETLRKELLETAMPFYEKMGRRTGDGPALLADRAWAMGRLAQIYQNLGDAGKAEEFFRESTAIHERLLKSSPENRGHREALTLHYNNLAKLLTQQGRYKEGLENQDRALELSEHLVARWPAEPELRFGLMTILLSRTFQLSGENRKTEAEQSLVRATRIGRELVAEVPAEPDYRGQLASCLSATGGIRHDARQIEESERVFREAMEIQEQLALEFPSHREYAGSLGITCHNLGHLLTQNGRAGDALSVLQRSVEISRRVVAQYSGMPYPIERLSGALNVWGTALMGLGRNEEAEKALVEAVELIQGLREEQPGNPQYSYHQGICEERLASLWRNAGDTGKALAFLRKAADCQRRAFGISPGNISYQGALRSHLGGLGELSMELGDHRAATGVFSELAGVPGAAWENLERMAVLLAKNLLLIDSDGTLSVQDAAIAGERCCVLATEVLAKAGSLGYTGLATARNDTKFAPLRRHAPFMALQEPPPDPVDRSPSRFTFDYPHDDPGKRVWTRSGEQWAEVQPSGKRNVYQIERRIRLGGISGTEAFQTIETGLRIFIPDKGVAHPLVMRARQNDGEWFVIGAIGDVE